MIRKRTLIVIAAVLVLAALLLYANVLSGDFIFDDYEYIVDNPLIRDLGNLSMSDPRQVGYLTFALNYALHGEDTFGYHLVNVLIHAANAFLVFLLAGAFLAAASRREAPEGTQFTAALLAAALFLAHPAQTQAVSYITQRFTSLAALFYLLAVYLYLKSRLHLERGRPHDRGYFLYALSLAATLLAMRTKEISFTAPLAVAAIEAVLLKESVYGRRRFIYLIPFGVLLLIIPLTLFGPDLGLFGPGEGIVEITRQEKLFDLQARSVWEYLLTQFRVIVIYLKVALFPAGQSAVYDIRASRSFLDPTVVLSLLLLLSLAAAGWRLWRTAPQGGDGAARKLAAAGIFWYFLTISVESSFIPIKDLIFEHRMYLPNAGLFAAAAVALTGVTRRILRSWEEERGAWLAFLICIPLAVTTYVRNDVWTTEVKFWDDVVRKTPTKPIGYNNRGTAYAKERQYELALRDLDITISFFPKRYAGMPSWESSDLVPSNMSKTYLTRGRVYLALGDLMRAEADFKRAEQIFTPAVDLEESMRMADLYYRQGAYGHAIQEFTLVLDRDPENLDALNNRGNAYSKGGRYAEAIRDFDQVIGIKPDFALAYYNRAIAFAWNDEKENAIKDFQKACGMGFQPACDSIAIVQRGEK